MRMLNGFEAPLWINVGHGICPWPLNRIYGAEDMNVQYTKENTEGNIRQDGLIAHIASLTWQLRQDVCVWLRERPGSLLTSKGGLQTEERKTMPVMRQKSNKWPSRSH